MCELKPCPFCGGQARDRRKVNGAIMDVYIQCRLCHAKSGAVSSAFSTTHSELVELAARKWNERVEVPHGC